MENKIESYTGKILISNASTVIDAFNQTVVLIIQHDKEGAFGLVLNKFTKFSLSDFLNNFEEGTQKDIPVYWGGPVDPDFVTMLHSREDMAAYSLEILPGIYLARHFAVIERLSKDFEDECLVYHGYAGWGANQLESEILRKSWVIHNCKKEFIFSENPEDVWKEALKSKGGIYKYFAEHTKDPFLN